MTRGAFEKRWTVYGGWLQVLPGNGTWSKPCTAAFATNESMEMEKKAFKIAIFCAVEFRDRELRR